MNGVSLGIPTVITHAILRERLSPCQTLRKSRQNALPGSGERVRSQKTWVASNRYKPPTSSYKNNERKRLCHLSFCNCQSYYRFPLTAEIWRTKVSLLNSSGGKKGGTGLQKMQAADKRDQKSGLWKPRLAALTPQRQAVGYASFPSKSPGPLGQYHLCSFTDDSPRWAGPHPSKISHYRYWSKTRK